MKTIGMRGDAAHGVHRHGAANHLVVLAAPDIGPLDIQFNRFFERDMRHLQRHALNRFGGHPAFCGHIFRCVALIQITLGHELHRGFDRTPIGRDKFAEHRRRDIGIQRADEG